MRKGGGDSQKKLIIRKVQDRESDVAGVSESVGGMMQERQPSMVQFQLKFEWGVGTDDDDELIEMGRFTEEEEEEQGEYQSQSFVEQRRDNEFLSGGGFEGNDSPRIEFKNQMQTPRVFVNNRIPSKALP